MSYKISKKSSQKEIENFKFEYWQDSKGTLGYCMGSGENDEYFFALEPDEIMQNGEPVKNPDYAVEQLDKAKESKYIEANKGARAYLESGEALYELTQTQHIEATDGNIGKLGAYALGFITGLYGAEDVVPWNTKEDETITLNQEQLTHAIAGLGQVQAQVWNVKFPAYKAQIEACETADEVNAILIDFTPSAEEIPQDVDSPVTNTGDDITKEIESAEGNI